MCDQQRLRPACAYAQSDQSLCLSLEYPMSVMLLTDHHLRFLGSQARLSLHMSKFQIFGNLMPRLISYLFRLYSRENADTVIFLLVFPEEFTPNRQTTRKATLWEKTICRVQSRISRIPCYGLETPSVKNMPASQVKIKVFTELLTASLGK